MATMLWFAISATFNHQEGGSQTSLTGGRWPGLYGQSGSCCSGSGLQPGKNNQTAHINHPQTTFSYSTSSNSPSLEISPLTLLMMQDSGRGSAKMPKKPAGKQRNSPPPTITPAVVHTSSRGRQVKPKQWEDDIEADKPAGFRPQPVTKPKPKLLPAIQESRETSSQRASSIQSSQRDSAATSGAAARDPTDEDLMMVSDASDYDEGDEEGLPSGHISG